MVPFPIVQSWGLQAFHKGRADLGLAGGLVNDAVVLSVLSVYTDIFNLLKQHWSEIYET